jgi:ribonuclease P protein component
MTDQPAPSRAGVAVESTSFPRAARLTETDDFSSVFALRPRKRSRHFVLYVRENGGSRARLGLVIGKKFAPRAVERNLVKRVARELFRQRQRALGANDILFRLQARFPRTEVPTRTALTALCRTELSQLLAVAESAASLARSRPECGA